MSCARPLSGASAIALALAFNIPYVILAETYNYPDVLRGSAASALDMFAAGGAALILTWHGFALCALALAPLSIAISITPKRIAEKPGLAIGAAILGALAGLVQAMGLWRWVFVVPALASTHANPESSAAAKRSAEGAFDVLNNYGGVAIGEHLGQLLTALFVASLSTLQWGEGKRLTAGVGAATALAIALGTGEGLAIALDQSGAIFSLATISGFAGLTAWLIATGIGLLRSQQNAI